MDEDPYPIATYRWQLNAEFGFKQARDLVPYLSRLGVTHVYSSPILRARPESTHGYDVVDPTTLNPKIGDESEFRELVSTLQAHGMGLILDIVPNHMAASHENVYWREVLTYGASSPHARWFDIDWRLPDPQSWGRVLVPVLGQRLQNVLNQDQLRIVWESGRFEVRYFDHVLPLDPATVPTVCRFALDELAQVLPAEHSAVSDIRHLLELLAKLPRHAARVRRSVELPLEDVEMWLAQLAQRIEMLPQIHDWAVRTCQRFVEGEAGRQRLKKLLDAQCYRLVYWRQAARAINYRRFFDINDLIALRQEDPEVFGETHALIGRWAREGLLDGVRVDHLDGLRDPAGYLRRLVDLIKSADRPVLTRPPAATKSVLSEPPGTRPLVTVATSLTDTDPHRLSRTSSRAFASPTSSGLFHIFVEKILAHEEHLPDAWPVNGTTGYEFLIQVESLFIHPEGYREIERQYLKMIGRPVRFKNVADWGKRRVLGDELSAFVGRLADVLLLLSRHEKHPVELGEQQLVGAIVEVAVGLPVYRTYVDAEGQISAADRGYLQTAFTRARQSQRAAGDALDYLERVLLLSDSDATENNPRPQYVNFIQRFQQLTGPATAKGVEDTALYAYVPLASRNEVGGEPHLPLQHAAEELHRENTYRGQQLPQNMLCVTTHDTKRNADVRARLDVLSEVPKLWNGYVKRWQRLNRPHRTQVGGKAAPDPAGEYIFYQNLVGIWPIPEGNGSEQQQPLPDGETLQQLRSRMEQYMIKASREAKTRTSWIKVNQAYEDALVAFIRSVFVTADPAATAFLNEVQQLVARISRPAHWNALARTLIQLTSPGVPDIYQGDEIWNLALVDPDNRQSVDYEVRQQLLNDVAIAAEDPDTGRREQFHQQLLRTPEDGRIKLHVLRCGLHLRREQPAVFARGSYLPLPVEGAASVHVFSYARQAGAKAIVVVVPRFTRLLVAGQPSDDPIGPAVWGDTRVQLPPELQGRTWVDVLTHQPVTDTRTGSLQVGDALSRLPVALLYGESDGERLPPGPFPGADAERGTADEPG